jgi:hypothetical protein
VPTNQRSYFGSVYPVTRVDKAYTASVDAALFKQYTASVSVVIQPDRYYYGTVYTLPIGNYQQFAGSVYAYFSPITPDRYFTGSVNIVPSSQIVKTYQASVRTVNISVFNQTFQASTFAVVPSDKSYTATVVPLSRDRDYFYKASLRTVPTPPDKSYIATVSAKALNVNRSYTATVRPYVEISPGESTVRDTDINLLISYVNEDTTLTAQIAAATSRVVFLNAEIARLVAILNQVTNKPSCRLSSVSPQVNVPKTGGTTMQIFGFEFIPTCTVSLTQGMINAGTFTPVVQTESLMSFTLPNFTSVVGLNLAQPISIQVHNADGQDSEVVTFTLAP